MFRLIKYLVEIPVYLGEESTCPENHQEIRWRITEKGLRGLSRVRKAEYRLQGVTGDRRESSMGNRLWRTSWGRQALYGRGNCAAWTGGMIETAYPSSDIGQEDALKGNPLTFRPSTGNTPSTSEDPGQRSTSVRINYRLPSHKWSRAYHISSSLYTLSRP